MKERSGMPYDVVAYEADEDAYALDPYEEGLFHRMLRKSWMNGSIPADMEKLAALCRVRPSSLKKAWVNISKLWKKVEGNPERLFNFKQESERVFLESKRGKCSHAGKLSSKAREEKRIASTDVQQTRNVGSTSLPSPSHPIPSQQEEKETAPPALDLAGAFDGIWLLYPEGAKDGKKSALRHFKASVKSLEDLTRCHQALANYKNHLALHPDKPIKNGSTFFNNWEDWEKWKEPPRVYAGMIQRPILEDHSPHWCPYCEEPHEWVCETPDVCNMKHELACPERARRATH